VLPTATASFVDTNVLVYSADPNSGAKHETALALLARLRESGFPCDKRAGFERVLLSRYTSYEGTGAQSHEPRTWSGLLASAATVLPLTASLTFRALNAMPVHGFAFWDALIWAAAKEHGVTVIYSEDFQHDRTVEGVRFINPFVDESAP